MINENDIKNSFEETLRTLRKCKGYSQEYIAEKTGLHRTYISDIERGDRNLSLINIMKFCEVLDIKPSNFFSFMEKKGCSQNET